MPSHDFCLAYGWVVSFAVEFLKRIPWVKSNPQLAALIASVLVNGLTSLPSTPTHAIPVRELVICVLATWASAIATHEVVTHSVQRSGSEQ